MTDSQEINDIAKETKHVIKNFNQTVTAKISKGMLKVLEEKKKN